MQSAEIANYRNKLNHRILKILKETLCIFVCNPGIISWPSGLCVLLLLGYLRFFVVFSTP